MKIRIALLMMTAFMMSLLPLAQASAAEDVVASFSDAYAAAIEELLGAHAPGSRARVSVVNGSQAWLEGYAPETAFEEILEQQDLDMVVRLLIPAEDLDLETLADLSAALAQRGYYGRFSCCAVSDVQEALKLLARHADPETDLFRYQLLNRQTEFVIDRETLRPTQADEMRAQMLGAPFYVSEGVRITPYDRYAKNMRIKDGSDALPYFEDLDRLSPVYAFDVVGAGAMEIELSTLGIESSRVVLAELVWDREARDYRVETRDALVRGGVVFTIEIPRLPFCIAAAESEGGDDAP